MEAGRRSVITLAFALGALSLCGCANLGAVREFANSSARITQYRAATERYLDSADRQLADLPADARFDATRQHLQALKAVTAEQKATLLKLHATTTGYMKALAKLAGDDAYSISGSIKQVSGAIRASDSLGIDADHVRAYDNIVRRVSDWILAAKQARNVRTLVAENGADMDKLLEAMQLATEAYGIVLEHEQQAYEAVTDYRIAQWTSELPGDTALTPERRETIVTLLRRSGVAERAAQKQALKAQRVAARGLERVRQAHADMLRNMDRFDSRQVQDLLRAAADDLKSIRESIEDL
jgi:hypothetical protein